MTERVVYLDRDRVTFAEDCRLAFDPTALPRPERRVVVSPEPAAPWWRTERAYRRSGIDPERAELPPVERWLRRGMLLGAFYVAAHVVVWAVR